MFETVPGHSCVLHSLDEELSPSSLQSFPPYAGGGLVHVRCRVSSPPPQDFEQSPYAPHVE